MNNKLIDFLRREIEDKKVLLLGFGREGLSSLAMLKRVGGTKKIAVADQREIKEDYEGVEKITGKGYMSQIEEFDIVLKSPGVVLEKDREEYNTKITSQTEIFLKLYKNQTVGITGTKGKSTTATLIYHILKESGKKSVLLGNIGIPPFDKVDEIDEDTTIVFELSSHQLEYTEYSPRIALYLNIYEEHLDHYRGFLEYKRAKENIYRYQEEKALLYLGSNIEIKDEIASKIIRIYLKKTKGECYLDKDRVVYGNNSFTIEEEKIRLKGSHNKYNIAMAYAVLRDLGLSDEEIRRGLLTYIPLPHRLEYFGDFDGISYYDDSISTIPEATINAIKTVKNIDTIIVGGMDRGIDYKVLALELAKTKLSNVILMEETGKIIMREVANLTSITPSFILVKNLKDAVGIAKKLTAKGGACVMSPASASYGIFKNFEERGERFKELVKNEK